MTAQLITTSQIAALAEQARCSKNNKELLAVLDKKGIAPKFSRPYAKGTARYYDQAELKRAWPELFEPPKSKVKAKEAPAPAPVTSVTADKVLMKRLDDLDKTIVGAWRDIEELSKFQRVDVLTKVDVLLKGNQVMWKTMQEMQQTLKELLDAYTKPRS